MGEATTAWGYGLATTTADGTVLDTWYPHPQLGHPPAPDAADAADAAIGQFSPTDTTTLAALERDDPVRDVSVSLVRTVIDLAHDPKDAADAYLRLHLLSHRLVAPHGLGLGGLFGVLANVVWTDRGPCAVEGFESTRLKMAASGRVQVIGVDKFPRMTDYVVPTGVRIADADRVRLGAHLAPGTTVMHEGFVNFNAGTLGTSMVEGRISSGVVVGDGSDVGGGASIMGTLSGGGTQVVSVGRRCLIGAEAGIGISLGDDCVVEAGLYVTAGTKVRLLVGGSGDRVVRAAELSGASGLLYRRNSLTGAVEVLPRAGKSVELNPQLHAN